MMVSHEGDQGILPASLDRIPVEEVAIDELRVADTPRIAGEDEVHVSDLAGIYERLPPLLVHRPTMRVIDGMHRLHAARMRGETRVKARFVEGDEASAFVLAVHANVSHGLPLSQDDKRAAAVRIMDLYPDWSDRRISSVCGVSAKTVAALRKRPTDARKQLDKRMGRDGKARPVDIEERRKRVRELLQERPRASLRGIAQEADVSPETVRSIRAAMEKDHSRGGVSGTRSPSGEKYVSTGKRLSSENRVPHSRWTGPPPSLQKLRDDPAVRSSETGRHLIQMLSLSAALTRDPSMIMNSFPEHVLPWIAEATDCSICAWLAIIENMGEYS